MQEPTNNVALTRTSMPSFLKTLLRHNGEIYLAYDKNNGSKVEDLELENTTIPDVSQSVMDLTGSPLKVDLQSSHYSSYIFDRPSNWTDEEKSYLPISLDDARQFIYKFNCEKLYGNTPKPIYCICDATDADRTVVLGALQSPTVIMRTLVYVSDCLRDNGTSIQLMKDKHVKNTTGRSNRNVDVDYKVTCTYVLYGYRCHSLSCSPFVNLEHTGNVLLEVGWNECVYDIPEKGASFKMIFQTIAGHVDSLVHNKWKELTLLQDCVDAIAKPNFESIRLCQRESDIDDLLMDISQALIKSVDSPLLRNQKRVFDINNLRDENILDRLWKILKQCSSLADLKICLSSLFEQLADMTRRIYIPENSKIVLIDILNGIVDGKLAVPNLSSADSLEIMIELGLEVLKFDYLCIIDWFAKISHDDFLVEWEKLSVAPESENVKNKHALSKPLLYRKSRMTFHGNAAVNGPRYMNKLAHLGRLHVVVEFLLLARQHCDFSEECLQSVVKQAYGKYVVGDGRMESFHVLKSNVLQDLVVELNLADKKFVKKKSPVNWHMQMVSTYRKCEVTTIFNHSEQPIFPTTVYNNYSLSLDDAEDTLHYITELVTYCEYFGKNKM